MTCAAPPPRTVASNVGWGDLDHTFTRTGSDVLAWTSDNGAFLQLGTEAAGRVVDAGEQPAAVQLESADGALYFFVSSSAGYRIMSSSDDGKTWSAKRSVTTRKFRDPAFAAGAASRLAVAWLNIGVQVSISGDSGVTWDPPVQVTGAEVCACCAPSIAFAPNGDLFLAYRELSRSGIRDTVVVRSRDGGRRWSKPVKVHADGWHVNYCPAMGPRLRVEQSGTVHVLWWTGHPKNPGVYHARSKESAATLAFLAPTRLSSISLSPGFLSLSSDRDGHLLAAWKTQAGPLSQLEASISLDGGRRFQGSPFKPVPENLHVMSAALDLVGNDMTVAVIGVDASAWLSAQQEQKATPPADVLLFTASTVSPQTP